MITQSKKQLLAHSEGKHPTKSFLECFPGYSDEAAEAERKAAKKKKDTKPKEDGEKKKKGGRRKRAV